MYDRGRLVACTEMSNHVAGKVLSRRHTGSSTRGDHLNQLQITGGWDDIFDADSALPSPRPPSTSLVVMSQTTSNPQCPTPSVQLFFNEESYQNQAQQVRESDITNGLVTGLYGAPFADLRV